MLYENLFRPIRIRGLELKNRVKFPATAASMLAEGGYVSKTLIDYHVARVKGGSGLNTTEATSVHAPSAPGGVLNISDDAYLPGLKNLTDAIHAVGGKACVQLYQGGLGTFFVDSDVLVFLPSDYENFGLPGASLELIHEVVQAYGEAAARSVRAGFDAIEFHVAHGYGPHAFLSGAMNHRTDEYGGSLENRARFPRECIRAMRANLPEDFPLIMRIVPFDDEVENGLTSEEVIQFCKLAKEDGVDALDVSRGNLWSSATKYEIAPVDIPRGFNVENAARIKRETGMIVITCGRINDPQQAEDIIAQGKADMVDIGRAQIADPEFCNKARAGQEDDIIRCIGCCQGCIDRCSNVDYPHISCLRNPAVGREEEFILKPASQPKKVLVAGGGVAGMEAAITLKQRGCDPILVEQSPALGGAFLLAGMAPRRGEVRDAVLSRAYQTQKAGVDIRLNTKVTPHTIQEIKPDEVILATGAAPIALPIPGADLPHVCGYKEVLSGQAQPAGKIVVIGGGLVGLETAEFLADRGNDVSVIEMLGKLGADLGPMREICVTEAMDSSQIKRLPKTKALEIKDHSIVVEKDGHQEEIEVDHVVVAIGSRPESIAEILNFCKEQGLPVHVIGDAVEARSAIDAIAEAAEIARLI